MKDSKSDTSKLKDYEKAISLSKDIINCRLRKIASLAASQAAGGEMIQGMAKDEKMLYTSMSSIIADWNERLLGAGILSES